MIKNASDQPIYILRGLSGISELEAILDRCELHPNPKWAPARDEAEVLAARLSSRHFGMVDAETRYQKDHLLKAYENEHNLCVWEQAFDFLSFPFEAQVAYWDELAWDVRRTDGLPLRSLEFLGRQIVAATLGVAGRLPDVGGALSDEGLRELENRLLGEASAFRRKRAGT